MTSQLDKPTRQSYALVEFRTGEVGTPNQETARYTDWTAPLDWLGTPTFTSEPRMSVKVPENVGTFSEKKAEVELPINVDAFTIRASNGETHERTFVTVREVYVPSDPAEPPEILFLFEGTVTKFITNPRGRTERVLAECVSQKGRIRARMGIVANHLCGWTLFGPGCFLRHHDFEDTGTVTNISERTLTVTGLAAQVDKYWHRGRIELLGLSLTIRDWDEATPTIFEMARNPPSTWLSQSVTVLPGCDKSVETCRARFNNEQFGGFFAYAMLDYNPTIEDTG